MYLRQRQLKEVSNYTCALHHLTTSMMHLAPPTKDQGVSLPINLTKASNMWVLIMVHCKLPNPAGTGPLS